MDLNTEKGNPGRKLMRRYTAGIFISNLLWYVFGQAQFFATTVLLIPVEYVTIAMVVFAIVDGINDPILGYLSDRSTKNTLKWGKRFPWIMTGAIGGSIAVSFIFLDVFNAQENPVLGVIWFCFTLCLFDTLASLQDVNSNALFTDKFRDNKLRNYGGGMIVVMATIGMLCAIVIVPMTVGTFTDILGEKWAFFLGAIAMTVICVGVAFIYRTGVREDKEMKEFRAKLDQEGRSSSKFFNVLGRALKDRNFMGYIIVMLAYLTLVACLNTGLAFWVTDAIGGTYDDITLPLVIMVLVAPACVPLWLLIVKKTGTKLSMVLGSIVFTIGAAGFYFVNSLEGAMLIMVFIGIGLGGNGVVQVTLFAQCVDNAAVKYGKREEGTYNGIYVVFNRLSTAIQAIIFFIVTKMTGYDPALGMANTYIAKKGLNIRMSLIPAVIQLLGVIGFLLLFNLTPEKTEGNTQKLKEMGL